MVKKKKALGIGLGIVFIIAIIGFGAYFGMTRQSVNFDDCSYTVLSLDRLYVSQDSELEGDLIYQLFVSTQQTGQCVLGVVKADTLKQKIESETGKDVHVDKDLLIGFAPESQEAIYDTEQICDGVRNRVIDVGTTSTENSCRNKCNQQGFLTNKPIYYSFQGFPLFNCYCSGYEGIGDAEQLLAPFIHSRTVVYVSNGNEGEAKRILGNMGQDDFQAFFEDANGNTVVYVLWTGGLLSGNFPPEGSERDVIISNIIGNRLTFPNLCSEQDNDIARWTSECIQECDSGISCTLSELNDCNNFVNGLLSTTQQNKYNGRWDDTSIVNNQVINPIPSNEYVFFDTYQVQVDADWLGIVESTGVPELSECEGTELTFGSEEEGTVSYKLKNKDRESEGTFKVCLEECGGDDVIEDPNCNTHVLDAGESTTGSLGIQIGNNIEKEYRCEIKAEAVRGSSDTCEYTIGLHQERECDKPNQKVCEGNVLGFCSENYKFERIEECPLGCEDLGSTARCIVEGGGDEGDSCAKDSDCGRGLVCTDGTCQKPPEGKCGAWLKILGKTIIPDFWCIINQWLENFKNIFAGVLAVLALMISAIFAKDLLDKARKTKKQKTQNLWIAIIIGLVLAVAVFLIAKIYFWFILIVLIIVFVVRRFIKKTTFGFI